MTATGPVAAAAADDRTVTRVLYRAAAALDGSRWDEFESYFTGDAEADLGELGGRLSGAHVIAGYCRAVLERYETVQHFVSNVLVEYSRDRLVATSYVHAVHIKRGRTPFEVGGVYRDRFRLDDGRWLIEHRDLAMRWMKAPRRTTQEVSS